MYFAVQCVNYLRRLLYKSLNEFKIASEPGKIMIVSREDSCSNCQVKKSIEIIDCTFEAQSEKV